MGRSVFLSVALWGLLVAVPAWAQSAGESILSGLVLDGPTETPIAGAVVRAGDAIAITDARGAYRLSLPAGAYVLEVHAALPGGWEEHLAQPDLWAAPGVEDVRAIRLVTGAFLEGAPVRPDAIGVPYTRPSADEGPRQPIDLLALWARRHPDGPSLEDLSRLELPDVLPETIRVLRAYNCRDGCGGTGGCPITEVDLDTYAAGVVTAEIGVFRSVTDGEDSQLEGFKTFAVAARAYALWFWANDPEAAYHLDDTACNQRYTDGPYPAIITQAAQETSGQVLIQAGTDATIDKFEYAASCGRCGTQPEYQEEIVLDVTDSEACTTGGWCGHNTCAGHADNPACPLEGSSVRCLVRGVCQWGTAERSIDGQVYTDILAHYQPNLVILDANAPLVARLLGFVRERSVETGLGISGARVGLDTGESTTTNQQGLFVFEDIQAGTRFVSVRADGYEPLDDSVEVAAEADTWHNVALVPVAGPVADDGVADAGGGDPVADAGGGDVVPDVEGDAAGDVQGEPDAPAGPPGQDAAGFVFGRFGIVPEEGLDGGCGCRTAAPGSPQAVGFVLVCLLGRLARRRAGRAGPAARP